MNRAVSGGYLSRWKRVGRWGRDGIHASHLFFVDDTLIFCEALEDHSLSKLVTNVVWCLGGVGDGVGG